MSCKCDSHAEAGAGAAGVGVRVGAEVTNIGVHGQGEWMQE